MTSLMAAGGSGRSTSVIPAVPAAWSVTTIAFILGHLSVSVLACFLPPDATRRSRRKRAVAAPGTRGSLRRHRQAHHRHHVLRKLLRRLLPRQQQEEDPRDGRRRAVAGDRDQTADPRASTVRAVIPRHDESRKRDRRASVRSPYGSHA